MQFVRRHSWDSIENVPSHEWDTIGKIVTHPEMLYPVGAPKPPFSPPTPPSSTQMYKHNHQNGPSTAPRGGPLAGNTPREGSPRGDFVPAVVILLKLCIFVRGGR